MAERDELRGLGMAHEEQQWIIALTKQESESKKIGPSTQSPLKRQQDPDDADTSPESCSPLGLTLRKTPSFMNLLEHLSKGNQAEAPKSLNTQTKTDNSPEKHKASNFPVHVLKIGAWEKITRNEGDLVAKLYYSKHKLVWEILDGALKNKIEIQWGDITAIRAHTPHYEPGTLEIELGKPPLFYREMDPQPRKHTLWQQASDVTRGQASQWRRHFVLFPPGILDKNYQKLLDCDQRISALNKQPFPTQNSPYFTPPMFEWPGFHPGLQYNYQGIAPGAAHLGQIPNSALSESNIAAMDDFPMGYEFEGHRNLQLFHEPVFPPQHMNSMNDVLDPQNYQGFAGSINGGESPLTGDSQGVSSEENMPHLGTNYQVVDNTLQQDDATIPLQIQWGTSYPDADSNFLHQDATITNANVGGVYSDLTRATPVIDGVHCDLPGANPDLLYSDSRRSNCVAEGLSSNPVTWLPYEQDIDRGAVKPWSCGANRGY